MSIHQQKRFFGKQLCSQKYLLIKIFVTWQNFCHFFCPQGFNLQGIQKVEATIYRSSIDQSRSATF